VVAKVVVAVAGLVCFLLGIRFGQDVLRWTGIALVAVAWLLRFVARPGARSSSTHSPSEEA
jgi:hypothetical protein